MPSFEFYRGTSQTGEEFMAIATNVGATPSVNAKTANMVQIWILPVSEPPTEAVKSGLDAIVCGQCRYRPLIWKKRVAELKARNEHKAAKADKPCYVYSKGGLARAANSVWRSHRRGNIPFIEPTALGILLRALNKPVRFGAWGDPSYIPERVRALVDGKTGTSYTSRWRECPSARKTSMASVSTLSDMRDAWKLGFRTYRVDTENVGVQRGEIHCPEQAKPERNITCSTCLLCSGQKLNAKSIMISPI